MPHRYICTVLEEMRALHKTHNYAMLESQIEEVQILANRMEAALWEQKDHEQVHKELKEAKIAVSRAQAEACRLQLKRKTSGDEQSTTEEGLRTPQSSA